MAPKRSRWSTDSQVFSIRFEAFFRRANQGFPACCPSERPSQTAADVDGGDTQALKSVGETGSGASGAVAPPPAAALNGAAPPRAR